MTITYQDVKQDYEDKGVVFMEDITREHYNLTMIVHASLDLNNTIIFCSAIGSDWILTMSEEIHLIVFTTLRKFCPVINNFNSLAALCFMLQEANLSIILIDYN